MRTRMGTANDRITRADVARGAGVSESTVSRALNDSPLISEAIKLKVRSVSESLGYIPNRQAALLARNRTYRIGLVVPTYKSFTPFSRSYFPPLLDGVLQRAEERGYSITIILDAVGESLKDLSLPFLSREVDGLLFSVTPMEDPRFAGLKARDVPFVLVNNRLPGIHCIDCDVEPGMREAVLHARNLGHTGIAYIAGDRDFWDGRNRLETFRRLTDEYGLGSRIEEGNFSMTSGREAAARLLESEEPPTMVMCASDRTALGVLSFCRQAGVDVPGDLSVIGFDDLGPARDSSPGLTTVHHPVTRMGGRAAEVLMDLTEGRHPGELVQVESACVLRNSTGPPGQPAARRQKAIQKGV